METPNSAPKASCKAKAKPTPTPKAKALVKTPSFEELKPASKPRLARGTQLSCADSKQNQDPPKTTTMPSPSQDVVSVPASQPDTELASQPDLPSPPVVPPPPVIHTAAFQDTCPDTQPSLSMHDGRSKGESPEMKRPKTAEADAAGGGGDSCPKAIY